MVGDSNFLSTHSGLSAEPLLHRSPYPGVPIYIFHPPATHIYTAYPKYAIFLKLHFNCDTNMAMSCMSLRAPQTALLMSAPSQWSR